MEASPEFLAEGQRVGIADDALLDAAWRTGVDMHDLAPLSLVIERLTDREDVLYLLKHAMAPKEVLALLDLGASFAHAVRVHAAGEPLAWACSLMVAGLAADEVVEVVDSGYGLLSAVHLVRVEPRLKASQLIEVLDWGVAGVDAAAFLSSGGTLGQLKAFALRGLDIGDVAYAWPLLPPGSSAALVETYAVLVSGAVSRDRVAQVPPSCSATTIDLLAAATALAAPVRPRIAQPSRAPGQRAIS